MFTKRQFIMMLTCLMLLIAGSSLADDKPKIQLKKPPPNKLGAGDLWKLDISNPTNKNINVYLTGTATEEKDGLIVEGKSKVFTIKPGKKTYGYDDFKDGEVNWKNKTTQEAILRTGNVKSGTYSICVTAFYENGSVADNEQCITQVIDNKSTGMITLISPGDGEKISPEAGVTFAWTGTGLKGPYTLTIKELKSGQTNEQAMKENRVILQKDDIKTTSYNMKIDSGKEDEDWDDSYIWVVSAGDVESEVYTFGREKWDVIWDDDISKVKISEDDIKYLFGFKQFNDAVEVIESDCHYLDIDKGAKYYLKSNENSWGIEFVIQSGNNCIPIEEKYLIVSKTEDSIIVAFSGESENYNSGQGNNQIPNIKSGNCNSYQWSSWSDISGSTTCNNTFWCFSSGRVAKYQLQSRCKKRIINGNILYEYRWKKLHCGC